MGDGTIIKRVIEAIVNIVRALDPLDSCFRGNDGLVLTVGPVLQKGSAANEPFTESRGQTSLAICYRQPARGDGVVRG